MAWSVVFWNVERMFRAAASPLRTELADGDPDAWGKADVNAKLENLRAVLAAVHAEAPLAMVGVCEVETKGLVRRLGQGLPAGLVSVDDVAVDSSGFALDGLNIGLLINRELFDGAVTVTSHVIDRTFDTRDILECTLESSQLDEPVTVYVNHWASRLATEGGEKRVAAAHYLRSLIRDRLRYRTSEMLTGANRSVRVPKQSDLEARADLPIVVMGDFNDEPFDDSMQILSTTPVVKAVREELKVRGRSRTDRFRSYKATPLRLFDPFWQYATGSAGSYYRSPRWRTYDQILLSRGLLRSDSPLTYVDQSAHVFNDPDVTRPNGESIVFTNRTGKPKSFDSRKGVGCSDHFPVVVELTTRSAEHAV